MTILTSPSVAQANDSGACYMVTSSGKTISLGALCGIKQLEPTTTTTNTNIFRVPIKRRSYKTPIINVTFNKNQSFEMILDTGATGILVTQAMAKAMKLQPEGRVRVTIADGSIVLFDTAFVSQVRVGGVSIDNARVVIAPKAEIGLLGHGFFENYDIKILEKEIEFHKR